MRTGAMGLLLGSLGLTLLTSSCGEKGKSDGGGNDIHMIELETDSTLYGIYLRGGSDSIQWITEEGDTAWLISNYAQIFGEPEAGDRIAVMLNEGKDNELRNVIDITQLIGRWVEPDAVEEGMMQGIELLDGGSANSINSRANHYVSWRLYNGKLLLVNSMEGMVDQDEPEDTLYIEELTKQTLRVRENYNKHTFRHSDNAEAENELRNSDYYNSPDSRAFDPEGEAPEGSDPEIPEEDRLF